MTFLVLLSLIVCNVENGQLGDDCENLKIQARSCPEAVIWSRGWIPEGYVVVHAECIEQQVASR
jgi:hypothetical protein